MPKDIHTSMYMDGQINSPQIEPSAFCWRPYWASRFESLWSLLRKFAYLNAITHDEIRRLFRHKNVSQDSNQWRWKWFLRADLRSFAGLDPSKLSTIFGIGHGDLVEATVLPYVHENEAVSLTSEFLRFCPTCISQGFHTPLHQLLFLVKCSAHGDRLESRCTDCLTQTIPYKFPSVSSKDLSTCIHMLYGLSQHLTHSSVEEIRKEAADRERALLSDAKWLMKRTELNTPEQTVAQFVPLGAKWRCFTRYIRRLPAYWADVMPSSCKASFNISKLPCVHIRIRSSKWSSKCETSNRDECVSNLPVLADRTWKLELFRTYKAIRRYLIRSYLSHHRWCIIKVRKDVGWNRLTTWQGTTCPAANALLLWRMFWEGASQPHLLFRPLGSHRERFDNPRVRWDPPIVNLPDRILLRIFTLECLGIFQECLLVVEALYRRGAYPLQLHYMKGRRIPHWVVEQSMGGEFTIHWWASRPLSSFFGQSSLYFKSCEVKLSR